MGRKKILERKLARWQKKKEALTARALASNDANEVRNINEQLEDIVAELADIQDELEALIDDDNNSGDDDSTGDDSTDGTRQQTPTRVQMRGGNPLASYRLDGVGIGASQQRAREENEYGSMEYRQAFMAYVQRGTQIPQEVLTRAAGDTGTTLTDEIGAIIPETIMNEFIKEVSKVRGNIYSKVRKLNVQGGVKFPISKLGATFKWITETTVSEKQKAGDINEFIVFAYNIGEIRVATSLLAQVVSLAVFESEIVKIMLEAYLKAMDEAIISGTGVNQPLGITKDTRVTGNTDNIITMTEEDFTDWTAWRKKLFSKVPLSKRGSGEFLFPASTVESYLLTMRDDNDRPLFKEATDLSVGNLAGSFFGRKTDLVEPDIIADFATAAAGDVVGIFWVPNDYIINTNMQFGMKRWFDDDTNEWINKGLTIVDGKIGDVSGCYLIKKGA